jgi:AAA domain-containing protein
VDLLASLCDELRIPYSESDARQKPLVDALYRHLLEAHAGGRTTVLLIDEAQNLSPPVLEQVRLLTNLETTKKKLLQIILIGQPELCEVLARSELRQLAQRITARYHLVPFSRRETFDYIAHRIEVAGGSPRVFSPKARAEVYRQSKGVPRLINVFCDRALLGAYVQEQASVNIATARRAIGEVRGIPPPRIGRRVFAAAGGLCVTAAVSFWLYGNPPAPWVSSTPAVPRATSPSYPRNRPRRLYPRNRPRRLHRSRLPPPRRPLQAVPPPRHPRSRRLRGSRRPSGVPRRTRTGPRPSPRSCHPLACRRRRPPAIRARSWPGTDGTASGRAVTGNACSGARPARHDRGTFPLGRAAFRYRIRNER